MLTKTFSAPPVHIGKGQATFWLTRRGIDLCGDDVDPNGADFSIFQRNPVALWNHETAEVIGGWTMPRIVDDGLQATITFAGTARAQEIRELVQTGFVKSASIGFEPIKATPLDPSRPRGGQFYEAWRLIEISLCATPANTRAILIDFQDKSLRSNQGKDYPMTREQRLRRAAEIAEQCSEPAQRNPIEANPTAFLNSAGKKDRASQVAAEGWHAYKVLGLQRAANPEVTDRLATAERLAAVHRLHGLDQYIEEKAAIEAAARKAATPSAPAWARGW